jgi:pimeloyl-ACP methyl ester carboxylesterase
LNPSSDNRVAIAVIRLRASDLEDYRGPVFTNPGGPGGSGIESMRDHGKTTQTIIGKNHDLISFDPRGIGASTPSIRCFSSAQNAQLWSLQDVGTVDSHPGVLYDYYARSKAISEACVTTLGDGNSSALRFVGTASVARDMLEIMHLTGTKKLKYWGFSYGTVLGGMFAALYPDKVERMVNDG